MSQTMTTTAADRFTDDALTCWPADAWQTTAEKGLSAEDTADLRAACAEQSEDYATAEAEVMAFVRERAAKAALRTYECRDECGSEVSLDTDDMDEAVELAEQWCREGDWGSDGASIVVWVTERNGLGEEIDDRHITVEIEPAHMALIRAATGRDVGCGDSPDDHDWTSEGEGGCDENPGVWSTGGTSMFFASHCRNCGLRRREHHCGSQRNPGDHDTTTYEMPDSWCAECESEDCTCEPVTVICCVCGADVNLDEAEVVATDHGPDHVCDACEYDADDE